MQDQLRPILFVIGPSIAYVELTHGQYSTIEAEDAEMVGRFNWYAHWEKKTRSYYARRHATENGRRRTILLHKFILSPAAGLFCDHINGGSLDNRRAGNLREATHAQNCQNCRIHLRNTSGHKGVTFNRSSGQWVARITVNNKLLFLGGRSKKEEAVVLREAAELEYYGEFRRTA